MAKVRIAAGAAAPRHEMAESIAADRNPDEILLNQLFETSPPALRAHHRRVTEMSRLLAERARLGPERAIQVSIAGRYHDIGMALVPWHLVKHCDTLGFRARELIKRHSQWGHDLLAATGNPSLQIAARVALEHHERWDGSGYPHHLEGEEICIEARLVSVCAIYDDLRHPIGGGAGLGHDSALAILVAPGESGRPKFDPRLTDILVRVGEVFRRIAESPQGARTMIDSSRPFEATFERVPTGIAHIDTNGRWLRVNQR